MPSYKLTYFNGRGRAETMRWMFAYAGQQYEDNRVTDQWKELKPKTPFGQMPLLEVDGKVICQSHACERYLAKTFGIYGSNDWEGAEIDMVIDYLEDLIKPFVKFIFEKDETKKAEMKKKYEEEELPVFLKNLEKLLVKAGGQHFVGNKLSYADIGFACVMGVYLENGKIAYDKSAYPKLLALKARVENEPKIKAWIEKRPPSSF